MKCFVCIANPKAMCECGLAFCEAHGFNHSINFRHILQRGQQKDEVTEKCLNEINKKISTICRIQREVCQGAADLIRLIGKLSQKFIERLENLKSSFLEKIGGRIDNQDESENINAPSLEDAKSF